MKYSLYFTIAFSVATSISMDQPLTHTKPSLIRTLDIAGSEQAFYTPDGNNLIIRAHNGAGNEMTICNAIQEYKKRFTVSLPPYTRIADASPDSTNVITLDVQEPILQWNIQRASHAVLSQKTKGATNARFNREGNLLAFSNEEGACILDLASNTVIAKMEMSSANTVVAWNPANNAQIAASSESQDPHTQWWLWDWQTGEEKHLADLATELTAPIEFSDDGNLLVAGAADQFIVCNIKTAALAYFNLQGKKAGTQPLPIERKEMPYAINFVPGQSHAFFAGSSSNEIIYCDLDDDRNSFTFRPQANERKTFIKAIAVHPNGKILTAGNAQGGADPSMVQLWDISAQK